MNSANRQPEPDAVDVHIVPAIATPPPLIPDWTDPDWARGPALPLLHFHPRSSAHRPAVHARLLYDPETLYLQFRVEDRYVRSVATRFMDPVCRDSCVEFFVQPRPGVGYFNFEVNAGGTLLAAHVTDPRRKEGGGLAKAQALSQEAAARVRIVTSLPPVIETEIESPTTWVMSAIIPCDVFDPFIGPARPRPGADWRANFYKCADGTSHPHWASWRPIGERLNFHCPEYFGRLRFA